MAEFNEQELVARCQGGDEAAFRELVEHYRDFVFALIARTISDRGRAEELAQDVFLRVYRGLPYFRGEARISTWIYRIVANLCAQERSKSRLAFWQVKDPDQPIRTPSEPATVDVSQRDLELRDRLEKALARLPAQQRLLVAAHYLRGVQYEELAEALRLPLGTVKTQLYRAKRQLRKVLETELR